MKEGIHPKYTDSEVTCACGAVFTIRSTKPRIKLDICSQCHPFFTGKQKLMDTAGRVEQFKKKYKEITVNTKRQPKVKKVRVEKKKKGKVLTSAPKLKKEKTEKTEKPKTENK